MMTCTNTAIKSFGLIQCHDVRAIGTIMVYVMIETIIIKYRINNNYRKPDLRTSIIIA